MMQHNVRDDDDDDYDDDYDNDDDDDDDFPLPFLTTSRSIASEYAMI